MLPDLADIRKRRKILGITQFQLAKKAGVSQSLIAKLESAKLDPTYSNATKIFLTLDKMEVGTSKKIKDVMNTKIIKIESSDLIKNAIKKMKKSDISQMPVFDGVNHVGSLSDKTILDKIASGESMEILVNENVEEIMEDPFPSVSEDVPVKSVAPLLQYNQALIVLRKGKFIGFVTKHDLLK